MEQITKVLTASGDFAVEKEGTRLFIDSITISGNTAPTSVNVRQTDGSGTIIWSNDDMFGHFTFPTALEGLPFGGSGEGDLYIDVTAGTTPKVSLVGSRGKPRT